MLVWTYGPAIQQVIDKWTNKQIAKLDAKFPEKGRSVEHMERELRLRKAGNDFRVSLSNITEKQVELLEAQYRFMTINRAKCPKLEAEIVEGRERIKLYETLIEGTEGLIQDHMKVLL